MAKLQTNRGSSRNAAAALLLVIPAAVVGCAQAGETGGPPLVVEAGGPAPAPGDGSTTVDEGTSGPDATVPALGWTTPGPLNVQLIDASSAAACQSGQPLVGPAPLRRISRVEYDNMVRDLLGDTTQPATQFTGEPDLAPGVNFGANTYTYVQDTNIPNQYLTAAEALAAAAALPNSLLNLLNQVPANACATQNDACAQAFVDFFANKAFRGQYDATESSQLFQIYANTRAANFDFPSGIRAIITVVLTSPRFLYVLEFGQPSATPGVVLLSPNELATRLSLFLWRSLPDDVLLQAAANGQLSTPDQLQAQAVRMLGVTESGGRRKAQDALDDFSTQWLELEMTPTATKDTQFGAWSAHVGLEMRDETLTDFSQIALADGGLPELLTASSSYIDPDLAAFYFGSDAGLGAGASVTVGDSLLPSGQTTFVRTALPNRAGVLTSGSVMATQAHTSLTSPTLRGKLVREQLLCDPVPAPPSNGRVPLPDGGFLVITPPPAVLPSGLSTRQVIETTHEEAACYSCHQYMDPIGFAFGHYDATGAYQSTDSNGSDGGPPIDASAVVLPFSSGETAIAFADAVDLAGKLAADENVAGCYALEEFRYALGRIESSADSCSAQQVYGAFVASGLSLESVILAMVRSDAFRYRNAVSPAGACQ